MNPAELHTFAIPAYKESPYLEDCVRSLLQQEAKSRVIMCTSTPNAYIADIASRYDLPLSINPEPPGIASDWNFAIACARTPYVTIAHQDDTYEPQYSARMLQAMGSLSKPLLFFSDYGELRGQQRETASSLLAVKRKMLSPLKAGRFASSRFVRRRILSFGSAICCPSVTLAVDNLEQPIFSNQLKCDLDWQAWSTISRLEGQFFYDPEILMYHRIHEGSETSALIADATRTNEDLFMLRQFWPGPIASLINKVYQRSQTSNQLK